MNCMLPGNLFGDAIVVQKLDEYIKIGDEWSVFKIWKNASDCI